jgi:Zn-dependent protease with chaperone function
MTLEGRYFFPNSARNVPARLSIADGRAVRIQGYDGVLLADVPVRKVRVSPRLGNIARRFELSDGAHFETYDNDGVDALLRATPRLSGGGLVDRLERSWRSVAASVVLAALAVFAFVVYGIPAAAIQLAKDTPPGVSRVLADQTMAVLDGRYILPSKLNAKDRRKAQLLFDRVALHALRGHAGYRLVFRGGGNAVGPNAFALPDGRVVMTDELWAMVKNDEEIEGVFAHEISHVDHAHGLQRVYEAALVPAAIAVVTGDLSQVSQLSVILPGILVQSAYSRAFEQQADDDAAKLLRRMGAKPAHLADLLERMEKTICAKRSCGPSWLGSHPDTSVRAERLRAVSWKK